MTGSNNRRGSGRGAAGPGAGASHVPQGRTASERVKTARKRSHASTLWLERQLNDPYVAEARRLGYRSRAAFKLLQIDEKFGLLRPGIRVVDLGCAPGGWTQVVAARLGHQGRIVGIDLLPVDPVPGAVLLTGDFMAADAPQRLKDSLGGSAALVLSDMAANATGHAPTDHLRIIALAEAAYGFAVEVLEDGGAFVAKVLQGGTEAGLLRQLKRDFRSVKHAKPPASRKDSAETYVVATGFRRSAAER